jgi:23S rRNA (cytidine2498-2'-O)-methyltransferase
MNVGDDFYQGAHSAFIISTSAGFDAKARQELRKLLPGARVQSLFLKGNLVMYSDLEEAEVLARLREAETRLVAKVFPIQASAAVTPDPTCFADLAATAAAIGRLEAGQTFVVRAHRRGQHEWATRELEQDMARRLQDRIGAVGEILPPLDWQVTVQIYQSYAYLGVNHPDDLLHKELKVSRKYAPGERPLNRAQWKIREALQAFEIEAPAGGWVLDLGSAPGGWVAVLAETAAHVVAVDPAELDPSVTARPNVEHLKVRAETLLDRPEYHERFDLLTCDMNLDPAEAAEILVRLAPTLKPGAPAIMTVKYVTPRRGEHDRQARQGLAAAYEEIRLQHLPHNAQETTAAMRRKGRWEEAPK